MRKLNLNTCICLGALLAMAVAIAFQQSRPVSVPTAVAAISQSDPVLDGAIATEARRLRAVAGTDSECITQSALIAPQSAKDRAIVACFIGRLRQENRDAIARELFRLRALEVAGNE